jgi:hypothetical protein
MHVNASSASTCYLYTRQTDAQAARLAGEHKIEFSVVFSSQVCILLLCLRPDHLLYSILYNRKCYIGVQSRTHGNAESASLSERPRGGEK